MRKIVVLNIILLTKTKEVIVRKSGIINYGNYHSAINNIIDISKLVQLLVKNSVFEKQLGQKYETEISDLFTLGKAKMATGILCISIKYTSERIGTKYLQIVIRKVIKVMKWI